MTVPAAVHGAIKYRAQLGSTDRRKLHVAAGPELWQHPDRPCPQWRGGLWRRQRPAPLDAAQHRLDQIRRLFDTHLGQVLAHDLDPSCRSSSREHQAEHRVHVPTRRRRRCTQAAGLDQCPVDIPEQDPAHHSATVPVATGAEERSLSPYAGTEPPQRKASSPGPSREGRTCRRLATKRTRSMVLPLISVPLPLDQSRSVATKRCPR